ncbi:MAG: ATP-grasp domain-containing protein [Acidobacteriota bacterium]
MTKRQVNCLFTSVGRRVELLRAFRRVEEKLNLQIRIIALDSDPLAPALQEADARYVVVRLSSPEYLPTLADICRRERVDLVLPLIDPDIPVLAANRQVIEGTGARLAVVSEEAAETAADKWKTVCFFDTLGLRTPRSWLPGPRLAGGVSYPLFVKPRRGSAGHHTFKVNNEGELTFFANYIEDPIVQEYLPGPEITNDVVCDLDGQVLAVVSRQRIEARWGEVAKGVTIYDPGITAACVKIAQALPAIGPITVQCMMKDGVAYFTEINARLGGGIPLSIAAGVDSPCYLLARSQGMSVDIPPLGTYRTGLYLTRFDDSFFLTEDQLASVAGRRL